MPSQHQLALLWQAALAKPPDAEPLYYLKPVTIRRYQNKLHVTENRWLSDSLPAADLRPARNCLDDAGDFADGGNGHYTDVYCGCSPPRPDEQVTVRFGLQGITHICAVIAARIGRARGRNAALAPRLRERTPLALVSNDTLIRRVGVFCHERGRSDGMSKTDDYAGKQPRRTGVAELFRTVE